MQTDSQKKKKNKALSTTDETITSKRTIRHPVSFSEVESEKIKQYAFNSKLSISEYLRRAGLRRKITTPLLKEQWQFYNQSIVCRSCTVPLPSRHSVAGLTQAIWRFSSSSYPQSVDGQSAECGSRCLRR
jgi:hypothetical protein